MQSPTDEIKSKIDIVDLIGEYFPLKQAGTNFKALCPFHEEKTPSFTVSREKQFYHCFGCGKSGDIFNFIQDMERVEFPESLKILANKAGVRLPEYNPKRENLKTRLMNINENAKQWFESQMYNTESGKKAYSYLVDERGLKKEIIQSWALGYALDSWDALNKYLLDKGYIEKEIMQSGIVVVKEGGRGYYDRFRHRVMFPIEDYHGNLVGFTGRALREDDSAKYINSPQSLIYNKSEVIFGLYKAKQAIKQKDFVVIVEGNMDVIASHQAGVENVVAVSGTALTQQQVSLLKRLSNNFVFCFDSDEAGSRAQRRSIEMAWQNEINVKVAVINSELAKDPDELIKKDVAQWQNIIEQAIWAMDYFFDLYLEKYNPNDIASKKEVAKELLNLIIKLKNSIERDSYIKKLSEKIDVSESALREAINKANTPKRFRASDSQEDQRGNQMVKENINKPYAVSERLFAYMLKDEEYADYIAENLDVGELPINAVELYKALNVYYTKGYISQDKSLINYIEEYYPNLKTQAETVEMLSAELANLTQAESVSEIKNLIDYLKQSYIKKQLKQTEDEIRKLEAAMGNLTEQEKCKYQEKLNRLLENFSYYSKQLK